MLLKLKNHLNSQFAFLNNKKLFLAVSGGLDSMVLLRLLHQLNYQIAVLHCNFGLRGNESDADQQFVIDACKSLNVPVIIQKFDTKNYATDNKLSVQVAARNLRYLWFNEQLKSNDYHFVLTAHHLDDSLETFLINLSRGSGIVGLTGIPAQNNQIIRPLLLFSRHDILNFAQKQHIFWREDSSNATDKYLRNNIRHNVIPTLKDIQPHLLLNFAKTQQNLNEINGLALDAAKMVYLQVITEHQNGIEINLEKLLQLPNYTAYLYQWLHKYNFKSWPDVYQLVNAESGKKILAENHILTKNRSTLFLTVKESTSAMASINIDDSQRLVKYPIKLSFLNTTSFSNCDSSTIFVDKDLLQFPLTLRRYDSNDWFYPFGFDGKKKITKFLKDCKLSTIDKNNIWLLCSNEQIVWIINYRADNRFKISALTKSILKITTA